MPSNAMQNFNSRLKDVDRLVAAYLGITGNRVGRPSATAAVASQQGEALIRAGVVFLCAAIEGFVEDLFEEAAILLLPGISQADLNSRLFKHTTKRLNTPNVENTNRLYAHLGIFWILDKVAWQKFDNRKARKWIDALVSKRGQIAHGQMPKVKRLTLDNWKKSAEKYAKSLEKQVEKHIKNVTGTPPSW